MTKTEDIGILKLRLIWANQYVFNLESGNTTVEQIPTSPAEKKSACKCRKWHEYAKFTFNNNCANHMHPPFPPEAKPNLLYIMIIRNKYFAIYYSYHE